MSSNDVDQIKARLNIVDIVRGYVKLTKAGANHKGLCPFHREKTPSFTCSEEKQIFHCFGCNEGGDMFTFIEKIENVEFPEALRMLAKQAGIELSAYDPKTADRKERIRKAVAEATNYYQKQLISSKPAIEYLKKRGIEKQSIVDFKIGFAPQAWDGAVKHLVGLGINQKDILDAGLAIESTKAGAGNLRIYDRFRGRVMFPIFSHTGDVIGFSGRVLPAVQKAGDTSGKYINSPATPIYDKSSILFGLSHAKEALRESKKLILMEGNLDVVMSHQAGVKNAVAASGTALTQDHLNIIKRHANEIIFAFDTDEAGQKALKRSVLMASRMQFPIKVVPLTEKDPADIVQKSADEWKKLVKSSKNALAYLVDSAVERTPPSSVDNKKILARELVGLVSQLTNPVDQTHWTREVAAILDTDEVYIQEAIAKSQSQQPIQRNSPAQQVESPKQMSPRLKQEFAIVSLMVAFAKELKDECKSLEMDMFLNEDLRSIAKHVIKKAKLNEKQQKQFDVIALTKDDYEFDTEIEMKTEFIGCVERLVAQTTKERLNELSNQIRAMERRGDTDAMGKMMEEYSKHMQTLASISD